MPNHNRINLIHTTYNRQIQRAAQDFGDHEGMGTPRITRWIAQFRNNDIQLAIKILQEIKYYSTENIRAMVHGLVGLTYHHFPQIDRDKIFFIPVGFSFEGSSIIARALRDEIGNERRIKQMADLEKLEAGTFDVLVFIDDFSGTGNTLKSWWDNVETLVLPRNVPFAIALLVLNHRAREIIEQFAGIICVDELDENRNVVSPNSRSFTAMEKQKIIDYCRLTGCAEKYLLGYGECGLLIAFKHQCPNNSLPILWHTCEQAQWEGLFKRSAL
jgi:hypothetical protein